MVAFIVPQDQLQDAPASRNSLSLRPSKDARVKTKGFRALAHLLNVYVHMLAVVAILALWLTSIYGAFSYVWPNIFCREQIEDGLSKVRDELCKFNQVFREKNYAKRIGTWVSGTLGDLHKLYVK